MLQEGLVQKEYDVGILKQHFKTSARKLKLGRKWTMAMKICGQEKGSVSKVTYKPDSVPPVLSEGNGVKFQPTIIRSLWNEIQNI